MRRVILLGRGGAGKSRLARKIGAELIVLKGQRAVDDFVQSIEK